MSPSSRGIDRIAVTFDEPGLVGNAGLLLVATLVKRLGLESLIDAMVRIPSARGGFAPGRKVLTLVHAMVAGCAFRLKPAPVRIAIVDRIISCMDTSYLRCPASGGMVTSHPNGSRCRAK